jgi:predicted HD phosphohydrolase
MMERLITTEDVAPLLLLFERTEGATQREEYHPEGDVMQHSLQVVEYAFRETHDHEMVLAALMHDIGKMTS